MLGTDVCQVLGPDHDVVACDIDDFDITDLDATLAAVHAISPEVVLHLAAFTHVDACEDEKDRAFTTNARGTMNIARAARVVNARLVYTSTDYVFDGTKTEPYVETDEPNPINYYGLTKLYGEMYVRDLTLRHLIVRASWLFGPNGKNFIDTVVTKASEGSTLRVVNDQHGRPTYTLDLAKAMKQMVERRLEGTVHVSNQGETTWFELARYAITQAGLEVTVEPVSSDEYKTKAKRPSYSVLASAVFETSGIEPLPTWQEAVRHHLERKGTLKGSVTS
jgi:dTDP-4-dehydrorhamnose reductase